MTANRVITIRSNLFASYALVSLVTAAAIGITTILISYYVGRQQAVERQKSVAARNQSANRDWAHSLELELVSALPDPTLHSNRQPIILPGEIPSPRNPPSGCAFHPRCRYAEARCTTEEPQLHSEDDFAAPLVEVQRATACHFPERIRS